MNGGVYVFLGPPASGKGTQAELLADRIKLPHIALGDILREAVRGGTPLGLRAKKFMEQGKLVPDDLVISIASDRFRKDDCRAGFIVDGYPRTLKQEKAIEEDVRVAGLVMEAVIYINIDVSTAISRLSGRRSCKNCGAVYHIKFNPPKTAGACDKCGGDLYQRKDDTEEVIKTRFSVYALETVPLVEFFKKSGKMIEVSGEGTVDEVRGKIFSSLGLD